jgi:MFS family permease
MILYSALFSAFGLASPFLPAFLAGRGLDSEQVGFVLGLATATRLVCGPIAGRLADRLQAFRAEIAVCAILAASGALLYLLVHGFWAVLAIGLLQAAVLAPLVPLADALSLWEHHGSCLSAVGIGAKAGRLADASILGKDSIGRALRCADVRPVHRRGTERKITQRSHLQAAAWRERQMPAQELSERWKQIPCCVT